MSTRYTLTDAEYTFLTGLEKDLLERAKTASTRAATHYRKIAKLHSDFLALEEGKRASGTRKETAKQAQEALKLQRQQERLAELQKKMQPASKPEAGNTSQRAGKQSPA